MKLLELFSGTGSVGFKWREHHEVISVDIDGKFGPEIVTDILKWDHTLLDFRPDFIWASVPCEQYSIARTTAKTPRNLELADALVNKTLEIIKYFKNINPDLIWFIENPDSSLLWKRFDFYQHVRLDYCQYGAYYRKRTRIATNSKWIPRNLCNSKTCVRCVDGKHMQSAQRGPSKVGLVRMINDTCSLNKLHALPLELTDEILRWHTLPN
jgi:hypothetical protein